MDNNRFFHIQQEAKKADIYIFGDICEWPYAWLGEQSAQSIVNEIKDLDVDEINVHIDCYGGSIKEAWGIYNALKDHKANIHTFADGFVASAALYPFLAGDIRTASTVSAFYLHEGLTGAYGYADDLRKAADEIDLITDIGINAFVERAGLDAEDVREMMKAETWLTAADALEKGIATEILSGSTVARSQSARKQVVQLLTGRQKESVAGTPTATGPEKPEKQNVIKNFFKKENWK